MSGEVVEAFQRLKFALQCEEQGEEGEAYKHYIATLSFISGSLMSEYPIGELRI